MPEKLDTNREEMPESQTHKNTGKYIPAHGVQSKEHEDPDVYLEEALGMESQQHMLSEEEQKILDNEMRQIQYDLQGLVTQVDMNSIKIARYKNLFSGILTNLSTKMYQCIERQIVSYIDVVKAGPIEKKYALHTEKIASDILGIVQEELMKGGEKITGLERMVLGKYLKSDQSTRKYIVNTLDRTLNEAVWYMWYAVYKVVSLHGYETQDFHMPDQKPKIDTIMKDAF